MVLAHPACGEGKQREPKEQVQVRPKDTAANLLGGLEEVVVIVPVDAEIDEA